MHLIGSGNDFCDKGGVSSESSLVYMRSFTGIKGLWVCTGGNELGLLQFGMRQAVDFLKCLGSITKPGLRHAGAGSRNCTERSTQ
eukprot:11848546-Karenia_brevis.AAC.1